MSTSWEKTGVQPGHASGVKWKFIIGGLAMLAAVAYLIFSGTSSGAQYFISVDELVDGETYSGQNVRISGAVVGETIDYDSHNLILDFQIASIPTEMNDLALALYQAANDPTRTRIAVHMEGEVKPDLLKHEAQAILTGQMGDDGIFYASELLLKCPSRYEEALPEQIDAVEPDGQV